jgi:Xaa-Pro aminopeptidase
MWVSLRNILAMPERAVDVENGLIGAFVTPINRFFPVGFDKRKLVLAMERAGICLLLLTSPEDVFYTTGYTSLPSSGNPILYTLRNRLPSFSVIDSAGRVTLLCWGFSAQGVDFGVDEVVGSNQFAGSRAALKSLLIQKRRTEGLIGITSSCPYFVSQILVECSLNERLVVADQLMEELRLVKSSEEITLLRRSTEITEAAYREVFNLLRVGMGRSELAREARTSLMKNGATGISHITLSFTGANPEIDIDEPLEINKLATIDIGGIYQGYCSDTRRYAYTGTVPDQIRRRYELMVEIVDAVGASLVPGRTFKEVYNVALTQYADHGIELLTRFNHVGHNIGLETEERWIDNSASYSIKAGMVINIELYSTADTGEQIGNEDTYVIGDSGPTRISKLPRTVQTIS